LDRLQDELLQYDGPYAAAGGANMTIAAAAEAAYAARRTDDLI
jgi:hypothetical protein